MTIDVAIINTGTANIASMVSALKRLGAFPRITERGIDVEQAEYLVLPGVGTFAAAMEKLNKTVLVEPLRERMLRGGRLMAVCLGLQLLALSSDESPGAEGLGIIKSKVVRFNARVRVPQMGWNKISVPQDCRFLKEGYGYFANSFCLRDAPEGWIPAYGEHGNRFIAALEKGNALACQFHPELSGKWGLELISRWLEQG